MLEIAIRADNVCIDRPFRLEVHAGVPIAGCCEAEKILLMGGRRAVALKAHVDSLFLGNTEEGTRLKVGDWTLYCRLMYGDRIPEILDVVWPPQPECWVRFLVEARLQVSTYKRFQGVVGNVCEVANRFWM